MKDTASILVERTQTGVRLEKRILKVLKALADFHDLTLGDLLEGVVLHAFEGKCAFGPDSLRTIAGLKKIYGLNLAASASHHLIESRSAAESADSTSRAARHQPTIQSRRGHQLSQGRHTRKEIRIRAPKEKNL